MVSRLSFIRHACLVAWQEFAEAAPRLVQLRFRSPGRAVEPIGNFLVVAAPKVVEHEGSPQTFRQLRDRFLNREAIRQACQSWITLAGLSRATSLPCPRNDVFERDLHQDFLAEMHQHAVGGHAVQPRGKSGMAAERANGTEYGQKGFLRQIFRLCNVLQHAKTESENPRTVPAIELFKSVCVSSLRLSNRLGFLRTGDRKFLVGVHKSPPQTHVDL